MFQMIEHNKRPEERSKVEISNLPGKVSKAMTVKMFNKLGRRMNTMRSITKS